jgi:hypothetical protein
MLSAYEVAAYGVSCGSCCYVAAGGVQSGAAFQNLAYVLTLLSLTTSISSSW